MNGKEAEHEHHATSITPIPTEPDKEIRVVSPEKEKLMDDTTIRSSPKKQKKNAAQSVANFLYDSRRKTVLGRSSLNWAKLATFYMIFYLCLGCFFVGLLLLFASLLDRDEPRYVNEESTMAVRTTATVVGLGFRPQPKVDDNVIVVSDDPEQQNQMALSLRLYRDVYLRQNSDAKTEMCTAENDASELPQGVACSFSWSNIVRTASHPCSEENLFGFKNEQPCVLVKLNKVIDWRPRKGQLPSHIKELHGTRGNDHGSNANVYITCNGTNPSDEDMLTAITYYSLDEPMGSLQYGAIPDYYFPYRNAKDHVQPFVLAQFKDLPVARLISVTCRAWAGNIKHDNKAMRGMVTFQLYHSHSNVNSNGV